jgi:regulatory protein
VLLHLTDGEPFEVMLEALERSRLGVGDALSPKTKQNLLNTDADVRVRDAALNILSFRARTRSELRKKLVGKGFEPARIDPCLDRLQERGFINDASVAAAFVRDRLRHRPRGPARLSQELREKGITGEMAQTVVNEVLEAEEVTEVDLARTVAEGWFKRQGTAIRDGLAETERTPARAKANRRLYGFLQRRGFRGEALSAAMSRALELAKDSPD